MLLHIPALRRGKSYTSLEQTNVNDCRTGQTLARLSQVNSGIIRKDLTKIGESRGAIRRLSCAQLLEICSKAAELFLQGTVPIGVQGETQSPDQYVESLSATSGLPF